MPNRTHLQNVIKDLDRAKWYLWHGNSYQALETLGTIESCVEGFEPDDNRAHKLWRDVYEFSVYIGNNVAFISNFGERYRYGEIITTAFVESIVIRVISKRMVKMQQMRWTREGAHLLPQVRTKTLSKRRAVKHFPPISKGGTYYGTPTIWKFIVVSFNENCRFALNGFHCARAISSSVLHFSQPGRPLSAG